MRVAFYTLGCKVNQYESQILKQNFSQAGFDIAEGGNGLDVYVINSCTVTAESDRKTRQLIHRIRRGNPEAVIALTGCMPQAFPEESGLLEDVQVVTGAYKRAGLVAAVQKAIGTGERVIDISRHTRGESFEQMRANAFEGRTRAFVKIQDGCERYCSYCIIPAARGGFRSKPLEEVRGEAAGLAGRGFAEIVLVGINLSCYGLERGLSLADAVEAVCNTEGVERVRLSSLEPEMLSPENIKKLSGFPAFCPQFHLSLQSGSDSVLKRMNRHYTRLEYLEIVNNIRKVFNNSSITTDIMVGFPGETEQEFRETIEFAREAGFAKIHVFPYSRRKGTLADAMPGQLERKEKAERSRRLIQVAGEERLKFLRGQIGRTCRVLIENVKEGEGFGYSENYSPVKITGLDAGFAGKISEILINGIENGVCLGKI
ncbi:MAG: tRNA (N(6)-L-threonylcarbamoyladenosine(37)-C(2))-methylthiotransferase MtaB [Oscillospiraceae bacterium]|jgi:threonylcarbamoyladenosine tRNA methylthiotransferase MtaB|nr:tRNA (N(6)-L-threonylcarbamoyladenosine(37)-C(2))-methylthiotransferase MtaB [Oscillospiraceae bacterium]